MFNLGGANVAWWIEGVAPNAFHIHHDKHKVRRVWKLLRGGAIFRWTIRVKDSGFFRIKPRVTSSAGCGGRSHWLKGA
jgi:hypothetical protein